MWQLCGAVGTVTDVSPLLPAAVSWSKDGRALGDRGQVLHIPAVQVADSGLYRCLAANAAGTAELLYSLQVHGECTTTELSLLGLGKHF